MAKLNEKKIKRIIREMEKRSSVSGIAKIQKVSRRWVSELCWRQKEMAEIPVLGKPGRACITAIIVCAGQPAHGWGPTGGCW